jgi:hypothetical protein
MFTLAIHYLNGWAMAAADGARKEQAEWPPHPDRVFMALAAAWFETGEDLAEGAALRWLEAQPAPAITASDASPRRIVTSFVPVNDARMGHKMPSGSDLDELKGKGLAVLPEFRSRQPRAFPVAIPHEPTVYLTWDSALPDVHRLAVECLLSKLTHVGHSASLVQAWLENEPPPATLVPGAGVGARRLRVPRIGRLSALDARYNRAAWIEYHDLIAAIAQTKENIDEAKPVPRALWNEFPPVVLLAAETDTQQHPDYLAAKRGDPVAATQLVRNLVNEASLERVRQLVLTAPTDRELVLICVHAYERFGLNAIPAALAEVLSESLNIHYEPGIVQTNVVYHTGAGGYGRLARQAKFDGKIDKNRAYLLVDDFVGQGGTLANLRGHVLKKKAVVVGAVCLTGKPYSAKLNLTQEQLDELRKTHGKTLERWWKEHFGHPFDYLTQSEARYLARSPNAERIRNQLAAAKRVGSGPGSTRSHREERTRLEELKQELAERFPNGRPISLRPEPVHWQSYISATPRQEPATSAGVFDPQLIVFTISGKRLSLPTTLKLTAALRGALLKACPLSPQPEWFTGHRLDGHPSAAPHMALLPLPFVDAEHADGRVMGLALALPRGLDPAEAGECLNAFLIDEQTGQSQAHRLFAGRWFDCGIEMDLRERPPKTLNIATWTRASRVWASVTPVVLDRHCDGKDRWMRAVETVKDACLRSGLPRPVEVLLHPVSRVRGVPHAREFSSLIRNSDGGRRYHSHAVLVFEQPVGGPVLIGAGRFRGYGLCRPMAQGNSNHD